MQCFPLTCSGKPGWKRLSRAHLARGKKLLLRKSAG